MFRKIGWVVLVICVIGLANVTLAAWITIDRPELGIGNSHTENCVRPTVPSFWRNYRGFPSYNNELIADYFGVYAAYASNIYKPIARHHFDLKSEYFGWEPFGEPVAKAGGFYAEVYRRRSSDRMSYMIVFRGSDGLASISGLISELSYFTQIINPWDQYRTARKEFAKVRAEAQKNSDGLPVDYIVVGHELGGGLARHMAAAFPCTAAIAFNSTFISNNFRLTEPYDGQVVDLFADNDLLSRIAILPNPRSFFRITRVHQWYRVRNAGPMDGKRGMFKTATAMARIPVICLLRSDCELLQSESGDELESNPQSGRTAENISKLYCQAAPSSVVAKGDLCK
ncbi:hypothetical protein [Phyllobacterium sp. OV277]|uniref:hypothetical protein n=1 Tax=Phyllobacterium sp. OV277 TaxID=1882772 RepID=UPI00088D0D0F|nr:hypothetical protein [Phyllobacterium sp. OV277]SDO02667.1 hypothetical protein SAMN05443582_101777 [Phyllobacterium sp. OV277]